MKNCFSVFIFILFFGSNSFSQNMSYDPDLWLPDTIHIALGNTVELYNNNIAFIKHNDTTLHFSWRHSRGSSDSKKFYWTTNQLGNVNLSIRCIYKGNAVDSAKTILKVVNKINPGDKNLIAIGNSLTQGGFLYFYPQIISDLNFQVHPFGTQGTTYKHEGRPGWTFAAFLDNNSPFYIGNRINFKKYVEDNSFPIPDIIRISLGINDVFIEGYTVENILLNVFTLIDSINQNYPNSLIIIALPTLCESTGVGWIASYGNLDNFEPYQLKMREFWKKLYAKYSYGKYKRNIQLSFDGLFIDREDGYPTYNGLHPVELGYLQLIRGFTNSLNYYINKVGKTNIDTPTTNFPFKIFPNPIHDYFIIESDEIVPEEVSLYNAMGQLVLSEKNNNKRVTVITKFLGKGLYVCNIKIGQKHYSRKIYKI